MSLLNLIDLPGLEIYTDEIKEYIKKAIQEFSETLVVQEDSFLKFPTVGNVHNIYIDTTSNKTYRWSDAELKYYVVGSDYEDIKIIDGNFD